MPRRGARAGFLYVDMLVAITIMALMAALVIPALRDDSHIKVVAAAEILTSDIELAQLMSIAGPDDPVVVAFEGPVIDSFLGDGYILAYASDPFTPIARPTDLEGFGGQPYAVEFGKGRGVHAAGVIVTIDTTSDLLRFNGLGALDEPMPARIRLSFGTRYVDLEVSQTTGTITQTSGTL